MSDADGTALAQAALAWATRIAGDLGREYRYRLCSVFLYDSHAGKLCLAAAYWGSSVDLGVLHPGEHTLPLEGSIGGRVLQSGKPALVPDVSLDPDYYTYPGDRTRSELMVPILMEGRAVGVINVESPWIGAFGIADLERLQACARAAAGEYQAAGFASARLYRGGSRDDANRAQP